MKAAVALHFAWHKLLPRGTFFAEGDARDGGKGNVRVWEFEELLSAPA